MKRMLKLEKLIPLFLGNNIVKLSFLVIAVISFSCKIGNKHNSSLDIVTNLYVSGEDTLDNKFIADTCFKSIDTLIGECIICKSYYENKNIKDIVSFDVDTNHLMGNYRRFDKNGTLREVGDYFKSRRLGTVYEYFANGKISAEKTFVIINNGEEYLNHYLYYDKGGDVIASKSKEIRMSYHQLKSETSDSVWLQFRPTFSKGMGEFYIQTGKYDWFFNLKDENQNIFKVDTSIAYGFPKNEELNFIFFEVYKGNSTLDTAYSYLSFGERK